LLKRIKNKVMQQRSKLTKGSFGHNVLMMFAGTAIGQLGPVIAAPLLTRLYSPEMFGVQGAFTAIIFIIAVIAALRYEMAITLVKNDRDSASLIALCGLTLLATTTIFTLALLFFTPDHFAWADFGSLEPYRFLLPIGFASIGAYQIMVYVATQQQDYKSIAQTKLYQGAAGPLSQIAMGFAHWGTLGLMIGFVIGQSMGISQLVWRLIIKKRDQMHGVTFASIAAMAKRYKNFPLLSSWSGLINAAGGGSMLAIAIPVLYSPVIAGYIFLTDRIVGRPLLMISTSILQVYLGETAKSITSNPAAIRRRFLQLAMVQTGIVSFWLLIVNGLAGFVFPLAFGEEWGEAVPYLHILSIALLPQLVTHALIHTLQVLERQGLSAVWEISRLIVVGGALIISARMGLSALDALLAYSICQAGAQLVLIGLMYRSIQQIQKSPQEDVHAPTRP
jgi:O-antigen/teichoic acid export membrane protein